MKGLPSLSSLALRIDRQVRARALLIARLAIALYIVELALNLARPHVLPDEPTLSIFYKMPAELSKMPGFSGAYSQLLSMPEAVFWTVLAGIGAAVLLQVLGAVLRPNERRSGLLTWLTLGCLFLPFGLISAMVVVGFFPTALACLPSTAFVLLLLYGGVRFGRVPGAALLTAFGWGALIVFGFGRACSGLAFGTINGYLGKTSGTDINAMLKNTNEMINLVVVHLGILDALAIGAGVALLLLLFRYRVTDTVTGLTLGAAVGLGYSFVESILFIQIYGSLGSALGSSGGFEYWIRQSIGLLGGQVAFGALLGAGFVLAAKSRRRVLVSGLSLLAAGGGSVGAETLSGWISARLASHVTSGGALDTLVVSPFLWLLPQLPFIGLAVALLVVGLRERAPLLRDALDAEAAAGVAITPVELAVLASPAQRFGALASTWRWYGRASALTLHRLQSAQLDLASWHVQKDPDGDPAVTSQGDELRARVLRLKNVVPAVTS